MPKTVQRQIKIDKIFENTSKSGRIYWVVTAGEEKYWVWEKKLLEGILEGDDVVVHYLEGEYPKATKIEKIGGQTKITEHAPTLREDRQRAINKTIALKSAAQIVAVRAGIDVQRTVDDLTTEIVEIAEKVENWLNGEKKPVEKRSPTKK